MISFLFPRGKVLKYSYQVNDIASDEIIAPFTFPILKSDERLQLDLNDRKILVENFTDNDLGTLYGAAELIFKGWPNEALPFSIKKKSIISGFFDRFFN